MSSRRVLVVALLGAAAYCSLDPEAPPPPAVQRPAPSESPAGITPLPPPLAPVTAPVASVAPSPAPAIAVASPAPPRPAPEATGRIEPLLAAPQIVQETKASPYAVVTQPEPPRAAWFPMPAEAPPIREAAAPRITPYYPPPPMYGYAPPPDNTEALNRLIETTQELESRVQRLDTRLSRRPEPRPPEPRPPEPRPRVEESPGPRLEAVLGAPPAPPAPRRRPDPDTARGFDLAVRLIRRLMARIDRIEENLDIQEESEPVDRDLRDPSATGLWRYAPPVGR